MTQRSVESINCINGTLEYFISSWKHKKYVLRKEGDIIKSFLFHIYQIKRDYVKVINLPGYFQRFCQILIESLQMTASNGKNGTQLKLTMPMLQNTLLFRSDLPPSFGRKKFCTLKFHVVPFFLTFYN